MLVTTKEICGKAREGKYAVGAFNVYNTIDIDAVIDAAEELGVPVIVMTMDYEGDDTLEDPNEMGKGEYKDYLMYLRNRAAAAKVPVAIHLDHCTTYEGCIRAIQYGATSVMLDASMKSYEENVALTKKVVAAARACGVSVEAEIGHVSNNGDNEGVYTTIEDAKMFYEATDVDMLAVSIGTAHGVYAAEPSLQYELIAQLRDAIPVPLVMHGGSGLAPEQYQKAAANGICKVNFCTYMQIGAGKAIEELVADTPAGDLWFAMVIKQGKARSKELVKEHIGYFGTKPHVL